MLEEGLPLSLLRDASEETMSHGYLRMLMARPRLRADAWIVYLATVASCSTGPSSDTVPPLQTEQVEYRLSDDGAGDYDLVIPWTYKNRQHTATYYDRCGSRLEKNVGDAWILAFRPVCAATGSLIDTILPGQQLGRSFQVHACYLSNCAPSFEVNPIPGTYRVVAGFYATVVIQAGSTLLQDSLPTNARRSNSFQIALP